MEKQVLKDHSNSKTLRDVKKVMDRLDTVVLAKCKRVLRITADMKKAKYKEMERTEKLQSNFIPKMHPVCWLPGTSWIKFLKVNRTLFAELAKDEATNINLLSTLLKQVEASPNALRIVREAPNWQTAMLLLTFRFGNEGRQVTRVLHQINAIERPNPRDYRAEARNIDRVLVFKRELIELGAIEQLDRTRMIAILHSVLLYESLQLFHRRMESQRKKGTLPGEGAGEERIVGGIDADVLSTYVHGDAIMGAPIEELRIQVWEFFAALKNERLSFCLLYTSPSPRDS